MAELSSFPALGSNQGHCKALISFGAGDNGYSPRSLSAHPRKGGGNWTPDEKGMCAPSEAGWFPSMEVNHRVGSEVFAK
jgi:hypothetical protein